MSRDWWSLGVILFECLCGYPPFDSDDEDPMRVCKNIINWKKTLVIPSEQKDKLSKECISFVKGLICGPEKRLGAREGASELKAHPWFEGIDFERIREMEAPFVPKFSNEFYSILESLKKLEPHTPEFNRLIQIVTSQFDDFPDEPLPGAVEGKIGKQNRPDPKFLGFTYKKSSVHSGTINSKSRQPIREGSMVFTQPRQSLASESSISSVQSSSSVVMTKNPTSPKKQQQSSSQLSSYSSSSSST